jgi:four helix bundle protein
MRHGRLKGEALMGIRRFQDLDVWKTAHPLTLDLYKAVRRFPEDERFCLALQMRRAAISIGANIAEGFGRFGPKDQRRFINVSRGSAEELKYFLILARDLGYLRDAPAHEEVMERLCAMLHKLIRASEARQMGASISDPARRTRP